MSASLLPHFTEDRSVFGQFFDIPAFFRRGG